MTHAARNDDLKPPSDCFSLLRTFRAAIRAGLAALAVGAFATPAAAQSYAAYTVYSYNGGAQGMAGRIRDNGGSAITPLRNLKTGLNGDPQVEGVKLSSGAPRIAVTNRVAPPGAAPVTDIFNAAAASATPSPLFSPTWSNVRNMYGLVRVGSYLYSVDFDNARIVEINPSTFAQTGVTYTLPASLTPSGYVAHAQGIVEVGGKLYGLFTFADSSWATYAPSLLVRFTITGGSAITVGTSDHKSGFAGNGFQLAVNGSYIYVAGIGGAQIAGGYNANSRLQRILHTGATLGSASVGTVLAPDPTNFPYEIRGISFKGSTAYVLGGKYNSSWTMTGKLFSTTNFTTFATIDDFTAGAPGYFWAAQYTSENDRIWFVRGNQIRVYTAASPATPAATLSLTAGSLISTGDTYDNINDFAFVGSAGTAVAIRGYRSPAQISQSPWGQAARAIAQGRPELTPSEREQVERRLSGASAR